MEHDPLRRLQKRDIRRQIIAAIMSLDPDVRSAQESLLLSRFESLPGYSQSGTVLLYVKAFPEELETRPILAGSLKRAKRVICPRVDRIERRLRLYEIQSLDSDFEPGILGIPEPNRGCREVTPDEVDWALIPGLAFDTRCERLGRGGGHYDCLMPRLRPDTPRWAMAFDCQVVQELPLESHDIPIDGVATSSQVLERG